MCSQAVLNVFCGRLFEFHVATVSVECVSVACVNCVFVIGFGGGSVVHVVLSVVVSGVSL